MCFNNYKNHRFPSSIYVEHTKVITAHFGILEPILRIYYNAKNVYLSINVYKYKSPKYIRNIIKLLTMLKVSSSRHLVNNQI